MKIAHRRLVTAICTLVVAEVAAAAAPKSSIDFDSKDTRVANVVATSQEGDTMSYTCDYLWQITFHGGVETQDSCEAVVPAGSKKAVVCTRKYDKRISVINMLQKNCKPTVP